MDQGQKEEPRQLKLRGVAPLGGVVGKGEKEGKDKHESGGKLWVVLILGATILVSVIFSLKNKRETVPVERGVNQSTPQNTKSSGGWSLFKPAEYTFGD